MQPIWKKLNLKEEPHITVIDAPESFEVELDRLGEVGVKRNLLVSSKSTFLIAFVTQRARIKALAGDLKKMAEGDVVVWFCYPKKSSKRYTCEFDRDSGWDPLGRRASRACVRWPSTRIGPLCGFDAWSTSASWSAILSGRSLRRGNAGRAGAEREPGRTR